MDRSHSCGWLGWWVKGSLVTFQKSLFLSGSCFLPVKGLTPRTSFLFLACKSLPPCSVTILSGPGPEHRGARHRIHRDGGGDHRRCYE